ncbi:Protein kinase alk2, partial [Podila minutissima]
MNLWMAGIFLSDGPKWKFQRQLASNIFHIKAFREYTSDVFVIEGKKVIDYLGKAADEGIVVDFQELMLNYTLDSFGAISFGKSFGCLDNIGSEVPFAASLDNLNETCTRRLVDPLWKIRECLTGISKKVNLDKQVLRSHAYGIIDKRKTEGHHAHKKDFLQLFMEGKDDEGKPLSDELVVDNIITFTAAARDTTAHALTWMLYLVYREGTDKKIASTLIQEVDEVLRGTEPTYTTYKKQKFAEACFYEALRIYPSLPRNLRFCSFDVKLEEPSKKPDYGTSLAFPMLDGLKIR